jgi:hypothetical protein
MQQVRRLDHVVDVGRRAHYGVQKAPLGILDDVCLHAEVPLVAPLGPVHLGVTLALAVFGRRRCGNDRDIHHRAGLEHQTLLG